MKIGFIILLILVPLTSVWSQSGGYNDNFNRAQDPIEKQIWIQEHATRDKATLNFCNVPGEYDCNMKTKGFRVCNKELHWSKWNWNSIEYQTNCVVKK